MSLKNSFLTPLKSGAEQAWRPLLLLSLSLNGSFLTPVNTGADFLKITGRDRTLCSSLSLPLRDSSSSSSSSSSFFIFGSLESLYDTRSSSSIRGADFLPILSTGSQVAFSGSSSLQYISEVFWKADLCIEITPVVTGADFLLGTVGTTVILAVWGASSRGSSNSIEL